MMNLNRFVVEQAAQDLLVYKNPNIEHAEKVLRAIMADTGGNVGPDDKIESITFEGDVVVVGVRWIYCTTPESYLVTFPASILDADDPFAAADAWKRQEAYNKAKNWYEHAKKQLVAAQLAVDAAEAALNQQALAINSLPAPGTTSLIGTP